MLYVQDPVCGELIAWEDARTIIRFDGQLYYFYCLRCRN
jgi:YHS domain-containing protein